MDSARRASRRSVDYPKPESDLAEWATKIKALQRQVDADEEVEQKRLEAEIAAARQARLRRSRQFSRPSKLEDGAASEISEQWTPASPTSEVSSVDRNLHQSDALKKLMGQNAVHVPPKPPNEAVSLASFMGGRATGPRLNRHAAQQDAHDPTQYSQPNTSSPHPIFGKGGVAMPGMVSKQDLNGGKIPASKPGISTPSFRLEEPATKSNTLRTPVTTATERRRSISPTPVVGSEDFERYRPSASPTPRTPLKSQKSTDSMRESRIPLRSQKSSDRMSIPTLPLRSHKSSDRIATSGLRGQKSHERLSSAEVGSEDFERYRPSSSPQPSSFLRPQKSGSNLSAIPQATEKQRPVSTIAVNLRPTTPKSYGRTSPDIRSASPEKRSFSPEKPSYRSQYTSSKSPAPEQKPWVKDTPKTSIPVLTMGNSNKPAPTPSVVAPKPHSYLASAANMKFGSSRERTISTPSFLPRGPATIPSPSKSGLASTPLLARPIQPTPRRPMGVPVLPPEAVVPSPAFKKHEQVAKDMTPSISRLQGRGFVQNMVKTSRQLEDQSAPSSAHSSPAAFDKSRQGTAGKKSVLDRWQPHSHSASPPPSPTRPHSAGPIRRSATTDPNITKLAEARSTAGSPAVGSSSIQASKLPTPSFTQEPPLTPRTATRMMEKMAPQIGRPGSATTMFFEKPPVSPTVSAVDELGVKHDIPRSQLSGRGDRHHITSELPGPSGKPLIHPTKSRAKRPSKKNSTGTPPTASALTEEPEEIPLRKETESLKPSVAPDSQTTESKIGRLAESWNSTGPIAPPLPGMAKGPPSFGSRSPEEPVSPSQQPKQYSGIRHALPGMAKEPSARPQTPETRTSPPSTSGQTEKAHVPSSPRHNRIPSTGKRATVMEVAQALQEHSVEEEEEVPPPKPASPEIPAKEEEPEPPAPQARLRPLPSPGNADKRKSSFERYSMIALPPLKEEATPTPTPVGTLTRSQEFVRPTEQDLSIASPPETKVESKNVHIEHNDAWDSLPKVDVSIMFEPTSTSSFISPDARTISVDVVSMLGSSSTTITENMDIFYDSEVLAIVHRCKTPSSGLVDTFVWAWIGKRSQYGKEEEKKVYEMARRYGTTPVVVRQCSEPSHLVELLGGRLVIRQGTRAHWSAENTAMHLIRSSRGVIFVDEHDLSINNLCSAFSYSLSILSSVHVWYGEGSTEVERTAARKYAEQLAGGESVTELYEGKEDNDDSMFWMVLGDQPYANADYWKWRGAMSKPEPTMWRVNASKRVNILSPVEFFSQEPNPRQSVYVANCIWELFVLVGPDARGSRRDIRLALDVALSFARRASSDRPFTPNVHVVVFPSQVPLDLRLHFRDLDEMLLNNGEIPDHMNLVSSVDALNQLENTSWLRTELKDHSMLPLGIAKDHVTGIN
ncbi:hypothetical protein BKA70DRAFT_1096251 [Coprinopsis sp. MPI-PUGE-AT-0042]|nr:hypothetical protein BKA70DRAFT_1096251 [Coprinopsis sp. MPI-PUGE-AT-0042]